MVKVHLQASSIAAEYVTPKLTSGTHLMIADGGVSLLKFLWTK